MLYHHNFTTTQAIFKQNRLAWSLECYRWKLHAVKMPGTSNSRKCDVVNFACSIVYAPTVCQCTNIPKCCTYSMYLLYFKCKYSKLIAGHMTFSNDAYWLKIPYWPSIFFHIKQSALERGPYGILCKWMNVFKKIDQSFCPKWWYVLKVTWFVIKWNMNMVKTLFPVCYSILDLLLI